MVKIRYQPVKEIVVHEIIRNEFDDFVNLFARPSGPNNPPNGVRWVDGILFSPLGMPITPKLVDDRVTDGAVHWQNVNFTEMEKFQPIINHPQSGAPLQVVDNSTNTAVADFVRWLKNQPQWFPRAAASAA